MATYIEIRNKAREIIISTNGNVKNRDIRDMITKYGVTKTHNALDYWRFGRSRQAIAFRAQYTNY